MMISKNSRSRLVREQRARLDGTADEEGVALVSVVLFMVLLSGLSLVLLSVIIGQIAPSIAAQTSTQSIYAAEAGLQSGLSAVRSAGVVDATGIKQGVKSALPCAFVGQLDGASSEATYSVTVDYYVDNPTGKTAAWLTGNKITCGTASATTGVPAASQPKFAQVTSVGRAGASTASANDTTRTLAAVYTFRVTNENVPGGRISNFANTFCLQATTATRGSLITYVPNSKCTTANEARQLWVYDTDYKLKLASTVKSAVPLCIEGQGATAIFKLPLTGNKTATLEPCADPGSWNQLWSWTGDSRWMGQNSSNTDSSAYCLTPRTSTLSDGTELLASTTCSSSSFSPTPAVGPGAASKATTQIVNFKEFGRCADVTDVVITYGYMISYPCKQDPSGAGDLDWNHKWSYAAEPTTRVGVATQISVRPTSTNIQCLVAPTNAGGYVTFSKCVTGQVNQQWTRYAATDSSQLSYAFVSATGLCLGLNSAPAQLHRANWSTMTVATCNGADDQKWNAPASYTEAKFDSFKEIG